MPEPTQPTIESVNRGQSDTLKSIQGILITQVVHFIVQIGIILGHPLAAEAQLALTNALVDVSSLISIYFAWRAYVGRLRTTTVIAGSAGEKSMIAAGVTIIPRAPDAAPTPPASP